MTMGERVLLDHGEGGLATAELVQEVFLSQFGAPRVLEDAAEIEGSQRLAVSTDVFVVHPPVFAGGDIGKLAICGTVNDLAVMGAEPRFLTAAFVLEEGLQIALLKRVVASMAAAAAEAGVAVIAGDTKVVAHGEADQLYVTTTGIGILPPTRRLSSANCLVGDCVLISGPVGDHGMAVLMARNSFGIQGDLHSDCQPLGDLTHALLQKAPAIRCMRDPTRGGLATALWEIAGASNVRILILEEAIPIRQSVRSAADLLGIDPLYSACEGRLVLVAPPEQTEAALDAMRQHPRGAGAAVVGKVLEGPRGLVMETTLGHLRPILPLPGAQLPRIC